MKIDNKENNITRLFEVFDVDEKTFRKGELVLSSEIITFKEFFNIYSKSYKLDVSRTDLCNSNKFKFLIYDINFLKGIMEDEVTDDITIYLGSVLLINDLDNIEIYEGDDVITLLLIYIILLYKILSNSTVEKKVKYSTELKNVYLNEVGENEIDEVVDLYINIIGCPIINFDYIEKSNSIVIRKVLDIISNIKLNVLLYKGNENTLLTNA